MNHIYRLSLVVLKRPDFQSQKYGMPTIEEFGNKKARKVTVYKSVVFISKIKMVLIFYSFLTIFLYVLFAFCLTVTYNV